MTISRLGTAVEEASVRHSGLHNLQKRYPWVHIRACAITDALRAI